MYITRQWKLSSLFLVIVAQRDSLVHCVRSFRVNIFPMAGNLPVHRGETFTYRSLKTSHYMQTSFLYKRRLFEKCFVIHSKACFFLTCIVMPRLLTRVAPSCFNLTHNVCKGSSVCLLSGSSWCSRIVSSIRQEGLVKPLASFFFVCLHLRRPSAPMSVLFPRDVLLGSDIHQSSCFSAASLGDMFVDV